jgi:hypothetical protein
MPRGDGTGPPWGGGPGSGRGASRCLGPRGSSDSKKSEGRLEKYAGLIEMLLPLAASLVAMFKRHKVSKSEAPLLQSGTSSRLARDTKALAKIGVEADDSENLERGDEYAER